MQPIKDQTAIAGIGRTKFTRASGTTVVNLAAEASLNAIRDAGLDVQDIVGVITYRALDPIGPGDLIHALGIERCSFEMFENLGGGWNCAAVFAGVCNNVLVYRAMNGRTEGITSTTAGRTGPFVERSSASPSAWGRQPRDSPTTPRSRWPVTGPPQWRSRIWR